MHHYFCLNLMIMISTFDSAPAKIILFGEHFVVYNQPIILASINKRMKIECKIEEDKNNTVNRNKSFWKKNVSFINNRK